MAWNACSYLSGAICTTFNIAFAKEHSWNTYTEKHKRYMCLSIVAVPVVVVVFNNLYNLIKWKKKEIKWIEKNKIKLEIKYKWSNKK